MSWFSITPRYFSLIPTNRDRTEVVSLKKRLAQYCSENNSYHCKFQLPNNSSLDSKTMNTFNISFNNAYYEVSLSKIYETLLKPNLQLSGNEITLIKFILRSLEANEYLKSGSSFQLKSYNATGTGMLVATISPSQSDQSTQCNSYQITHDQKNSTAQCCLFNLFQFF